MQPEIELSKPCTTETGEIFSSSSYLALFSKIGLNTPSQSKHRHLISRFTKLYVTHECMRKTGCNASIKTLGKFLFSCLRHFTLVMQMHVSCQSPPVVHQIGFWSKMFFLSLSNRNSMWVSIRCTTNASCCIQYIIFR